MPIHKRQLQSCTRPNQHHVLVAVGPLQHRCCGKFDSIVGGFSRFVRRPQISGWCVHSPGVHTRLPCTWYHKLLESTNEAIACIRAKILGGLHCESASSKRGDLANHCVPPKGFRAWFFPSDLPSQTLPWLLPHKMPASCVLPETRQWFRCKL